MSVSTSWRIRSKRPLNASWHWVARLLVIALVATLSALSASAGDADAGDGQTFVQLGDDIDGVEEGDFFGFSSAMNAEGDVVVATSRNNNGVGDVRVLAWDGTAWSQRGSDIDGRQRADFVGLAVDMSASGDTIIVGAQRHNRTGDAQILDWNGTTWTQRGDLILGASNQDQFGSGVAVSADGNTVVIGARNGPAGGYVQVFDWDGAEWSQRGADLTTSGAGEFGETLAVSADGNVVLVADFVRGATTVFAWDGSSWAQRGDPILSDDDFSEFGFRADISSDGDSLVIGDPSAGAGGGRTFIFDWDGAVWAQRGASIDGIDFEGSGVSVAMSADGDTVVIGAHRNDNANGNEAGATRIFRWDGTGWFQQGADLIGEAARDESGYSVAINASGDTVLVGAPRNDGNGSKSGQVRVYRLDDACDPASCVLSDGAVVFLQNVASGRYLDGDGFSSAWNVDTSAQPKFDDRWRLTDNGDGTWALLNSRRNRYLDADGPALGWNVGQSIALRDDDRWEIVQVGDEYQLRNAFYGRYLSELGSNVVTVPETEIDSAARWTITAVN